MITAIIEAALRSVLVAGAVWLGLRAFRVSNVLAQKAAWGLVLAAAALMPMLLPLAARLPGLPGAIVVSPVHLLNQVAASHPVLPAPEKMTATRDIPAGPVTDYTPENRYSSPNRYPAPAISSSHIFAPGKTSALNATVLPHSFSLVEMAWLLYLGVAAVFLFRLVYGLAAAVRLFKTAEPVHIESWSGAALQVRASSLIASPVTIGSAVVLPSDYQTWDSEKLRIVLAHECSHILQRDFYLQLLAGLYAAFFWFSPLGWWLKRTLADLAEAISDRAALEEAASRSSYAQILLEFAASPRQTLIGVAMARPGSLSRRIERLLNDSSFSQAFAGTRRRALLGVLLVPVALFAATTLVRVEAAGQATPPPPGAVSAPDAPPSPNPDMVPPAPAPPSAPAVPPEAPDTVPPPAPVLASPSTIPVPPVPPAVVGDSYGYGDGSGHGQSASTSHSNENHNSNGAGRGYHYSYSTNGKGRAFSSTSSGGHSDTSGDSYAVIRGDGKNIQFSGEWVDGRREELAKARKMAHGDFLWFTRADKSYFVDDPAVLAQIEDMYKPMEALGKQQEELGRQQEALGKQQEELGRQQEKASIPSADMSKEIAEIEAAAAKLKASKAANMNAEEFAELQSRLGDLQGKIGEIQGRFGEREGEFGEKMGKLGEMQGKLGKQQGHIGEQQGHLAEEADRKVKSLIDRSFKNGLAKPIQ